MGEHARRGHLYLVQAVELLVPKAHVLHLYSVTGAGKRSATAGSRLCLHCGLPSLTMINLGHGNAAKVDAGVRTGQEEGIPRKTLRCYCAHSSFVGTSPDDGRHPVGDAALLSSQQWHTL